MNRILSAAIALLLIAGAAAAQMFGPAITINDVEVSRAKVQAQTDHLVNQRGLGSGGLTQPSEYRKIQEEIVEQLVVQELLWQEAQRRGIVVSEDAVDAELEKLKSGFQTDLAFQFRIEEGGYTEETFRENIRQQKSVQKMITDELMPAAEPDEETIRTFYEENIDQMAIPEQVRARHILVKFDANDPASRAAAEERIAKVQSELAGGANFAILATELSEDSSAQSGGDLGWFERGTMVRPFEDAAFALEPGEVSEVIETGFGFHIIRLEDRTEARTATLEETAPQIRAYLGQQNLENAIEALVTKLREEGDVQVHLWE